MLCAIAVLTGRARWRYRLRMIRNPSKGPLVDPLEGLLGYQLRRASVAAMADLSSVLAEIDLRPADMSVLLVVEANRGVTQSEVGRCLGIKRANMAPIVASLEERAFVKRVPVDGRSQALRLTRAGARAVVQSRKIIAAHESRLTLGMDEATRQAFMRFLAEARQRFSNETS